MTKKQILKTALSFLQHHEGLGYEAALSRIGQIIVTGDSSNNPLYQSVIDAGLPHEAERLHEILAPGGVVHA